MLTSACSWDDKALGDGHLLWGKHGWKGRYGGLCSPAGESDLGAEEYENCAPITHPSPCLPLTHLPHQWCSTAGHNLAKFSTEGAQLLDLPWRASWGMTQPGAVLVGTGPSKRAHRGSRCGNTRSF